MNKFKFLSYTIIILLYVILTLQVVFTFTQSFDVSKDLFFILRQCGFSFAAGLLNVLIMFGISNKIVFNLGSDKDHRIIKFCTYIITLLMIMIWTAILLFSIAFNYYVTVDIGFMRVASTAAIIAFAVAVIVIVALFSISIRTRLKK
jgi:hypothetical protein